MVEGIILAFEPEYHFEGLLVSLSSTFEFSITLSIIKPALINSLIKVLIVQNIKRTLEKLVCNFIPAVFVYLNNFLLTQHFYHLIISFIAYVHIPYFIKSHLLIKKSSRSSGLAAALVL